MRTRAILTLDQQDGSSDSIPRVAGNGPPRTIADRVHITPASDHAFFGRVVMAMDQLRSGVAESDVHVEHGMFVVREAQRRIAELPLAVRLDDATKIADRSGRRKVMRPCQWCAVEFGVRDMRTHQAYCAKKPK